MEGQSCLKRNRSNEKYAKYDKRQRTKAKTEGVYIPPFKLDQMISNVQDKSSVEYQRIAWDALKKSINGLVNKVNGENIRNIIPELFSENLIRGKGLFCRSCVKSQMASPCFTDVIAAMAAVVNSKFPDVGHLLLRRVVFLFDLAYKRNDKHQLLATAKFIAHLLNQQVVHELLALELLVMLLENPTDDNVEVAVSSVTECGSMLQDVCSRGLDGIFDRFRDILYKGETDKRVEFMIESLFALRKANFKGHPAVRAELDLVEPEDQTTHEISLCDPIDPEFDKDIFKVNPKFIEEEEYYEDIKKTILGDESDDGAESIDEYSSEEDDEEQMSIIDDTGTDSVNLRKTIYETIMSSLDYEEAGHKLLKLKLNQEQEMDLCCMIIECTIHEKSYRRFYGLLAQHFCTIRSSYKQNFEKCFLEQYSLIHRLETNKLRNIASLFAHLFATDGLPWHVLSYIRLTEDDTTSSSRIFLKYLFQELSYHLGIRLLKERLSEPTMQSYFESIFPRDNLKNTRFSINFFTSIGLGGITDDLREYLKNVHQLMQRQSFDDPRSHSESSSYSEESDTESHYYRRHQRQRKH
ncbi:pre-mRNA-splicing factor CWC22 [Tanacetum coccineum]|uniref:Pre-mRNA-splicing factor CWC22 n=1 Tax=Tanacetum coccineum TaxID=301880 RepID=A0ABQ4WN89_9ASTR